LPVAAIEIARPPTSISGDEVVPVVLAGREGERP
jgi:hypothetical protein